ncbi:MFS transporter [Rhizobium dioscoreae]|uniref:MFS transporter n=1 Tax=Rhizobium dioscoreae TaxID=2653122 RepID=UPI00127571DF|nr:MFS transporter [Rhizobium dioscoreae]GES45915.1 MFS transporter [Rhizobium dioscoreae]
MNIKQALRCNLDGATMSRLVSSSSKKAVSFTGTVGILLSVAMFINYLDRGNLATAGPVLGDELGLSNTEFGVLISAFFWIYVPGQLFAAWMVARFNAYRTLVVGLIVWSAATLLTGFAGSFASLLLLRVILGLGESASFPATSKLLAQNLPVNRLSFANAAVSAGIILGPAAGTFFGGMLMALYGWRVLFIVSGVLSLLWLIPWLHVTDSFTMDTRRSLLAPEPPFRTLLTCRELWATSVGHFANNYTFYTISSWLPLYLVKAHGFTLPEMARLGGVVYVATAVISLAAGWGADQLMIHGASPNLVRKTCMGAACVISMICMLMCAFGSPEIAVAGLFFLPVGQGLGGFNLYSIGQTLAGPSATAKWIGVQNCIGNVSGIVAPIITGIIVDATGAYRSAFLLAALMSLVGFLSWTIGVRRVEPLPWKP